jgi:dephospho-CoA kinase
MARNYKSPKLIAVTGGIGSGQTTISSYFKKWRCKVINADKKAHEVIQRNKKLQNELAKVFGKDIFPKNKQFNRQLLAERAFKDELHTHKLNQLVHPRMVEVLIEEMEAARFSKRYPLVVIDAALIFEISIESLFDAVVVVNAPLNIRQQRVKERDGMSRKQFNERAGKQIPLTDKVKWADFVIENDCELEELEKRTREVYDKLVSAKKNKPSAKTK